MITQIYSALESTKRFELALGASVQLVAEARNQLSEQRTSLAEQQRKYNRYAPVDGSGTDFTTKELTNALASAISGNEQTRLLLEDVDKANTTLAKSIFSIQDIAKSQTQILRSFVT